MSANLSFIPLLFSERRIKRRIVEVTTAHAPIFTTLSDLYINIVTPSSVYREMRITTKGRQLPQEKCPRHNYII